MKIAVLSDIHEGLNRKNTKVDILDLIKDWIEIHLPDVFIISGDMTARPEKALALLNRLQGESEGTQILFVHGNHDIYAEDSMDAYKTLLQFPGNLGNGPVHLTDDWVIIGDGGWYDYSFGMEEYTTQQFINGTFNNFTWPDKNFANWQGTDKDESNRYVKKLEQWLAKHSGKNIIMVTHTVPFAHFIEVKNDPSWDFFNSMMGSQQLGELAKKYGVRKYIFGHIHTRFHEIHEGIEMICNPLGYYPHEWSSDSPREEIFSTIKMIEL